MGFGGGNGFSPSRTIVEDSTKTGNDASQKHQFTGSVEISGGPLKLDGASITPGGGGGTPGGSDTQIQYNDGGAFGGASGLIYDDVNNRVGIGVADPDSKIEILSTTTQQKWSYDADSFATITVADGGGTTIETSETGNLTLSSDDIFLVADGGAINFADPDGNTKLAFDIENAGGLAYISNVKNNDLVFRVGTGVKEVFRIDQSEGALLMSGNVDDPGGLASIHFRNSATKIHSPSDNVLTLTGPTVDVAGTFSLNSSNVTSTAPELNLLDASNTVPSVGSWGSVERIGVYDLVGGVAKPGSASGVSYTLGTLPSGSVVTNAYLDITTVFTPTNSSPAANIEIALGTTTTFSLAGAAILNEASITALASGGGGGPTFDANTTLGVLNLKDAGFGNGLATATTVKKLPTAENVILKVTDGAGGTEGLESTSHAKLYIKYVVM
jgi:hypothetical protein